MSGEEHLVFQFILKVYSGAEVRALYWTLKSRQDHCHDGKGLDSLAPAKGYRDATA